MRIFIEAARGGQPGGFALVESVFNRVVHTYTDSSKQSRFAEWALAQAGARGCSFEKLSSSASTKMTTEGVTVYPFFPLVCMCVVDFGCMALY